MTHVALFLLCTGLDSSSSPPRPSPQALGCVLFELCALRKPFDASNMPAIIFGIMRNKPPPLPRELSEELRGMVGWLLQVRDDDTAVMLPRLDVHRLRFIMCLPALSLPVQPFIPAVGC
jgi:serine/threonine protein kinase